MRIVHDRHAAVEQRFPQHIHQEAGAPGHRRAGDRAEQMADERPAHARIEDDGHRAALQFHRIKPRHRPLARLAPDVFGAGQIGGMARGAIGIVALLGRALARQHAGREAVAGARIDAAEPGAGGQRDDGAAHAGPAAFAVGHAGYGARGIFCRQRGFAQRLRVCGRAAILAQIVQIEIAERPARQPLLRGQPGIGIFWRSLGHRHRPLGQLAQQFGRQRAARNAGGAFADEQPQADLLALRPSGIFQLAQAHGDFRRRAAGVNRVGGIGTGVARGGNQQYCAFQRLFLVQHRPGDVSSALPPVNRRAVAGTRPAVRSLVGGRTRA